MSYNVKNTAGTTLVVIPDRSIDRDTTSLALLGFNATAYGLDHAQNFVHLLEHFANDVAPDNPILGQLWFDTSANTMKVYHDGRWAVLSGTPSIGSDPNEGGIAGVYHLAIGDTSVAIMFAGGQIVAVFAAKDIVQSLLPATVTIDGQDYAFQTRFAFGLQGGVNLADGNDIDEADDYVFAGRVPMAEQAHFAGGGVSAAETTGWAYLDIAPGKSVGLMISCGQIIAAVSQGVVLNTDLPTSMTFYVKKDRDTGTGTASFTGQYKGLDANYLPVTCQVRSRFPAQDLKNWVVDGNGVPQADPAQTIHGVGLFPGLTFASSIGNGSLGQTINSIVNQVSAQQTSAFGTAIATATDSIEAWVDAHSATALKVTDLEAQFTSATGTTSIASAVQTILARASDTSATSSAITDLKTQFQTALGTSSFGEALSKLQSTSDATSSNQQALTQLTSTFTNQFGGTTIAQALQNLSTKTDSQGNAVAGYTLSLNSNGYVSGIQAANGGAADEYFKIITSHFIISDGTTNSVPFEIVNGVVHMHSIEVDTLANNSAVVPVQDSRGDAFYGNYGSKSGTPNPSYVVGQATIVMKQPGWIETQFNCKQGFHGNINGNTPWVVETFVNGAAIAITGGTVPGDSVVNQGVYYANAPGSYTVTAMWNGHNSITMEGRSLFVKGFPFTS